AKVESHLPPPSVVLERVLLNDEEVISDANLYGEEASRSGMVRVPAGGGKLQFYFTATSFRSPEKIRFRYKLEGFDSQWIQAGEERTAIYTKLPRGDYAFRVPLRATKAFGDREPLP